MPVPAAAICAKVERLVARKSASRPARKHEGVLPDLLALEVLHPGDECEQNRVKPSHGELGQERLGFLLAPENGN